MILTGETEVLGPEPVLVPLCPNLTWTDLFSNPGLHFSRSAINHLSHGTSSVRTKVDVKYYI